MNSAEIKAKKLSLNEAAFYLFFIIMFGMRMWGIYESKPLYGPLLVVGFIMWGLSILLDHHTVIEYLVICGFMGLAGIVYLNTGEKGLILYFALMLGMKHINVKRLFSVGAIVGGAGMACLMFLSSFDIIEDISFIQFSDTLGAVFRRSMGFPHPNTLGSSFVIIAMMIMFVTGYDDRKKVWKYSGIILGVGMYLYSYTGSRTGLFTLIGYLCLNIFFAYRSRLGIVEKVIVAMVLPAIWASTIILPFFTTESLVESIRRFDYNLGSRYEMAGYFLANNSFSLFGIRLNDPDATNYGIDFSQLYLLFQLGVVAFVIITALWIILLRDEVRDNRIEELVVTIALLFMGITDPILYNIGFKNLAFAFMGVMIYRYLRNTKDKMPEPLNKELQLMSFGDINTGTLLPGIKHTSGGVNSSKKKLMIEMVIVAASLAPAILWYVTTPEPEYVLADRNCGEKSYQILPGLEGNTYSAKEIDSIKHNGNIVLDYTDEHEQMYVYYANEKQPVAGGYYAPNAAKVEKLRKGLSIFFWGVAFFTLCITAKIKVTKLCI